MAVIGIIEKNNNIIEMEKTLEKYNMNKENIIMISEEKIENIKNVKFDILVINDLINKNSLLCKIIETSKYLIINTDYKENLQLLSKIENTHVITFGFNKRATITIISNEDNEIILDIQREFENLYYEKIESQEIKLERKLGKKHIYEEISMKILTILAKI